ncbi:hypothetical protein [Paraburkholderia sediminicola]|uniref:hypothetical protein n=1 Tax=Paraburkholderia sediminicola TaxID=458836 RepID=UPI0038B84D40
MNVDLLYKDAKKIRELAVELIREFSTQIAKISHLTASEMHLSTRKKRLGQPKQKFAFFTILVIVVNSDLDSLHADPDLVQTPLEQVDMHCGQRFMKESFRDHICRCGGYVRVRIMREAHRGRYIGSQPRACVICHAGRRRAGGRNGIISSRIIFPFLDTQGCDARRLPSE